MVGRLTDIWVRTNSDGDHDITTEQPVNASPLDVVEHYAIATPQMLGVVIAAQRYLAVPMTTLSEVVASRAILRAAVAVYERSTPGAAGRA